MQYWQKKFSIGKNSVMAKNSMLYYFFCFVMAVTIIDPAASLKIMKIYQIIDV
jgi:hypothetical protein